MSSLFFPWKVPMQNLSVFSMKMVFLMPTILTSPTNHAAPPHLTIQPNPQNNKYLTKKNTKINLSLTNKEQKTPWKHHPKLSQIPTQIAQLRNKRSYLFVSFPVLKRVFVYYVWLRVIAARRIAYSIVVRWWAQLLRKRSVVACWEWMFVGVWQVGG